MNAAANPNSAYPRDLIGYGRTPLHPRWPGGARIALQFVLNDEEGAENSVLHGDAASETFLSEIIGAQAFPARHMSMESLYEYGSRAGVWRVLRAFATRKLPLTGVAVAMAVRRKPELLAAYQDLARQPRPALDQLPEPRRGDRARAHCAGDGDPRRTLRARAVRLVHRARFAQHAASRRRTGRLSL